MVVKCTSAVQFTGQSTIGELLLLETEKRSQTKISKANLRHPQKFSEITSQNSPHLSEVAFFSSSLNISFLCFLVKHGKSFAANEMFDDIGKS